MADSAPEPPPLFGSDDAATARAARLRERMVREGYQFEFFQAIRLLAGAHGGPQTVGGPEPKREAVRISPDPASVFPASDIRHIHTPPSSHDPVPIEVGFGGLYGVDAALPNTFHERIATLHPSTAPLRDFLDLLSHRPYAQLWRAWARYRPEVRAWSLGQRDVHTIRAASLTGIPKTADTPIETQDLLPLAARLSAWARNAEGLQALLEKATGFSVRVLENIPRFVRLSDRPQLGSARLGVDAVVGETIHDESGKFRLEVGPVGLEDFRSLLPGGAGASRIGMLVELFTSDALDYDVDLLLKAEEAPPLKLGDTSTARLGRNAHLGTPRTPLVRRRVRYA
ncbi:MAG: type VI secretion system baseplate subunit TssG [Bacteroidota bacterium]